MNSKTINNTDKTKTNNKNNNTLFALFSENDCLKFNTELSKANEKEIKNFIELIINNKKLVHIFKTMIENNYEENNKAYIKLFELLNNDQLNKLVKKLKIPTIANLLIDKSSSALKAKLIEININDIIYIKDLLTFLILYITNNKKIYSNNFVEFKGKEAIKLLLDQISDNLNSDLATVLMNDIDFKYFLDMMEINFNFWKTLRASSYITDEFRKKLSALALMYRK